jgi:hypothetical protein
LDSVVTSTAWVPRVTLALVPATDPDVADEDELQAARPAVRPAAEATAKKDLRDMGSRKRPRWIAATICASVDSGIGFAPLSTNYRATCGRHGYRLARPAGRPADLVGDQ